MGVLPSPDMQQLRSRKGFEMGSSYPLQSERFIEHQRSGGLVPTDLGVCENSALPGSCLDDRLAVWTWSAGGDGETQIIGLHNLFYVI
jgi:hypothetical protein